MSTFTAWLYINKWVSSATERFPGKLCWLNHSFLTCREALGCGCCPCSRWWESPGESTRTWSQWFRFKGLTPNKNAEPVSPADTGSEQLYQGPGKGSELCGPGWEAEDVCWTHCSRGWACAPGKGKPVPTAPECTAEGPHLEHSILWIGDSIKLGNSWSKLCV